MNARAFGLSVVAALLLPLLLMVTDRLVAAEQPTTTPAVNPLAPQAPNPLAPAAPRADNPLALPAASPSANPLGTPAASSTANPLAAPQAQNPLQQQPAPGNPLGNLPTGQQQQSRQQGTGANPFASPMNAAQPGRRSQSIQRPALPAGWARFDSPLLGLQAYVPPGYWVRLKGGNVLCVEKIDGSPTCAFLVPFRMKRPAQAGQLAEEFARAAQQLQPEFRASFVESPQADLAHAQFTSSAAGVATEGRFVTMIAANGAMGYVIGISAPRGKLAGEHEALSLVANSFGFAPPRVRWQRYQSPAGGFTMEIPPGWRVESNDGQTGKSDLDMVVYDPRNPYARGFNLSPRYCTQNYMGDPLHRIRGYEVATFQSAQDCATASLRKIFPGAQLTMFKPDQALTQLGRAVIQQAAQALQSVQGGQIDIGVYACAAQTQLNGTPVTITCYCYIRTLSMNPGVMGQSVDLEVGLRGWAAPTATFIQDTPALDRAQNSYALTEAFLTRIHNGNRQAVDKIMQVNREIRQIDEQIRKNHWDTQDAIAEMNYDLLTNNGGYLNEHTGRIEQYDPSQEILNSRGERVSREEVLSGTPRDQATVLRDAQADDYMPGKYGRIQF